jgi:hypothetical protein
MADPSLKIGAESSYYCMGAGNTNGKYSHSKMKNQCCLKLPFSVDTSIGGTESTEEAINQVLTYSHVGNALNRPFGKQKDPAYRAQRFNGYTDLMGGAEEVPAFRAGVNFYENPAYGYQTMDFMINSLLSNPDLNRIVNEEQAKQGTSYKSLMCLDHGAGLFYVDTNHYFEKHKNTPRMKHIIPKIKSGSLAGLTSREKKVITAELYSAGVQRELFKAGHLTTDDFLTIDLSKALGVDYKSLRDGSNQMISIEELKQKSNFDSRTPLEQNAILELHRRYTEENILHKPPVIPNRSKLTSPEFIRIYAREIYPKRSTVGTASDFAPWGAFTDEQIEGLSKRKGLYEFAD